MRTLICIGLLVVCGCTTGNYTWTPTVEEWAAMTPMERNAWSANEMRARQNATANWQNLSQALQQPDRQPEITYIPGSPPVKLESWRYSRPESIFQPRTIVIPGQEQDSSTYWQEKNAKDEWWRRRFGFPK